MIKVDRPVTPLALTASVRQQKTQEFVAHKSVVWRDDYIVNTLREMSNGKCVYCECNLCEQSTYLEVDHFHPKEHYPSEVVAWDNLNPSCKHCNSSKGARDTVNEVIINPTINKPQEHIWLKNLTRFKGKDDLGQDTIDALNLNDSNRLAFCRYKLTNLVVEKLEDLYCKVKECNCSQIACTRKKYNIRNAIFDLLNEASPQSAYSAVKATALLVDENYPRIKNALVQWGLWTEDFESREATSRNKCLYDTHES